MDKRRRPLAAGCGYREDLWRDRREKLSSEAPARITIEVDGSGMIWKLSYVAGPALGAVSNTMNRLELLKRKVPVFTETALANNSYEEA